MTIDREEIRRDAESLIRESWIGASSVSPTYIANSCLALLDELEKADRLFLERQAATNEHEADHLYERPA